jgi:hypothetical protein
MKSRRVAYVVCMAFVLCVALVIIAKAFADTSSWDVDAFRQAGTIQIMTTEPEVGEHWFNLWVVVVDGRPYVRLGDRAYGRIQRNTTSPYVKLKVDGQEFDKVKVEEMPDMRDKVAAAMADKYFMDVLIRHESHPMVARLSLEASAPSDAPH